MADEPVRIANIVEAVARLSFPTIPAWNRLEGRPRAQDFTRALKAEVRDALWMLTRQWQMGEFHGDDAGSPAHAKIAHSTIPLNRFQAGTSPAQPFPDNMPLEAVVEKRPIPFRSGDMKISLDLRMQMGRHWLRLLEKENLGDAIRQAFIDHYPFQLPDPEIPEDAEICSHPATLVTSAAVAGRLMDGGFLYYHLKNESGHAYDRFSGIALTNPVRGKLDDLAGKFVAWFDALYAQPGDKESDAWRPPYLEYQFSCSAEAGNTKRAYLAEEYYQGHLDWYNLDLDPESSTESFSVLTGIAGQDPPVNALSFLPTTVSFNGMPNTRWWKFENGRTNFGDISPSTNELAKLLFIEFGLVYANDWFLLPMTLPVGSVTRIRGLVVTNVFGERFWIEPAGTGSDEDWHRWTMYTSDIHGDGKRKAELGLILLPTVPAMLESDPLEEVTFIRDEVANMVWGIEKTVRMPEGISRRGYEAAIELNQYLQSLSDKKEAGSEPDLPPVAGVRYQLMNTVAENWIPFIPVHVDNSIREIQLQRGSMPRILKGSKSIEKIYPKTVLLREGLDLSKPEPYFIYEEEVPRAGCQVGMSFQRTRWYNGRVVTWLGMRKVTGRGEGSSGLAFDQIVATGRSLQ
jgi:hypothetical protein